jgi:hypothetical protein
MDLNYTVKEGDTVPQIAADNNTTAEEVVRKNNLRDSNYVQVGQVLKFVAEEDSYEAQANATAAKITAGQVASERNRVQAEKDKARSLLSKAVKGPSQEKQTREEAAQFKAVKRGDLKSRPQETREEVESAVATVSSYFGDGPDATALLREVVIKESNMGQNPNTYKMVTDGKLGRGRFGVAQVDEVSFNDTLARLRGDKGQPQGLVSQVRKIKAASGIDLLDVEYEDLRDPVLSAMFARLHFMKNPDPISSTVEGRAAAWKKHYNSTAGKGTAQQYIDEARFYGNKWNQ